MDRSTNADLHKFVAEIFISYARSSAQIAQQIDETLRRQGFSVWRDDQLPVHRAYANEIRRQIDTALAVIVIWSADAVVSDWVRSEADRARNQQKLVQVSIDDTPLPMPFDQIQCGNLRGWSAGAPTPTWRNTLASLELLIRQVPRVSVEPDLPIPSETLLAILPFDNLSADDEMQFFSDGISEELIQRLSRGAQMKVIGRTSSFQFRGERKGQAAAELNCSHILDGAIRRAGEQIRLSAHLVEAATRNTIWTDRYDRRLDDVFSLQDELSQNCPIA